MTDRPTSTLTVGGVPLYPVAGGLLDGIDVIRPEYGGAGLLNDGAGFTNLRRTFAGGLLNGIQYNPHAGRGEPMLHPIAPSGVYTADPDQGVAVTEPSMPPALTFRDALTLMYGPLVGRDTAEMGGGSQLQAMLVNDVLQGRDTRWMDLDGAFDPDDESWTALVRRIGLAGNARGGGGDGGGGDGGAE